MEEIDHKNFREISKRVNNFLYIDRIAVDSDYRNKKLGSQLYLNIINFSENNSIASLTAEINLLPSINIPSFEFHKKFNFKEIDTVKYSEDYEVSLQKKEII
jgi:predicted GNAT superfamily acetyltransferase